MTFKSFTDNAKSFTFKHEFETMDHANVTSTAILGYMVGTYEQQPTEITIGGNEANNTFTMVVKYVEDKDLTKVFNRICESFESYSKGCSEAQVMKRLGYLSAFKKLKKVDIKCPNCWKMSV